jgi:hypothetical protein
VHRQFQEKVTRIIEVARTIVSTADTSASRYHHSDAGNPTRYIVFSILSLVTHGGPLRGSALTLHQPSGTRLSCLKRLHCTPAVSDALAFTRIFSCILGAIED